MENKKEYSKEELSAFLEKVNKKFSDNKTENIGQSNKEIVKNWLNEINSKEKIEVTYNKNLINENIKEKEETINKLFAEQKIIENKEELTKENFFEKFHQKILILQNEESTIPQKEEVFSILDNFYLSHQNILNDIIDITELEKEIVLLLTKKDDKEENNNLNANNPENNGIPIRQSIYINSVSASLTISSILMKRLITFSTVFPEINKQLPILNNLINEFTKLFPTLFICNDFRIRTCITNSIGTFTSYMLYSKLEDNLNNIIETCYKEIIIGTQESIENFKNKFTGENQVQIPKIDDNASKPQHLTLDTSKNILIEIIKRMPIEKGNFEKCQNTLIEYSKKLLDILNDDNNDKVIILLFLIYEILTYYLKMPFYVDYIKENITSFSEIILKKTALHLSFTSPRLRFWILNFLIKFNEFHSLRNEQIFMDKTLPLICLNRYLQVDGVKKNSMQLWKTIVEMEGINIIKIRYENFLKVYLNDLKSIGQVEKEAACRCIQELIIKVYDDTIHKDIVKNNYNEMINGVLFCCHDTCWNVRESALIALSYVFFNIYEFISNNKELIDDVCQLIKLHCFDNILEVRDASAFALKIYLEKGGKLNPEYEKFYINCIKYINDNSKIEEILNEVRKEIFPYITQKQDFGFIREVDMSDFKDGITHIIKELSNVKECFVNKALKPEDLLMCEIDYLCKNYNLGLSNINKKSIWECLTVLFLKINKYDAELYIDYIVDYLIKDLDLNINSLCGWQAERFVIGIIEGGINKRMIKSKVKNKIKGKNNLIQIFDKLLK